MRVAQPRGVAQFTALSRVPRSRPGTSNNNVLSASQALAEELAEAQAALLAVQGHLAHTRASTANWRRRTAEEAAEVWQPALARQEETAAASCGSAAQSENLRKALRQIETRCEIVEKAATSELYLQWRQIFEAHLRAGGRLEDFPLDNFILRVCDAVPESELMAPERAAKAILENQESLNERLTAAKENESKLRVEMASLKGESRALRGELQDQEATNQAWRDGRLKEGPRGLQIREEQHQHQQHGANLERELLVYEEQASRFASSAWRYREEAAEIRSKVLPCQRRALVLEEQAQESAGMGAQVRKKVEMQEFELGRHKLVRVWGQEARQLGHTGEQHQRQALSLLRHAATDRKATNTAEEKLRALWEGIGDRHREATALRSAHRHTKGLREAAENDLEGLREVNDVLSEQHSESLKLLRLAESVAAASPRLRGRLGLPDGVPTGELALRVKEPPEDRRQQAYSDPLPAESPARGGGGGAFVHGCRPRPL